METISTIYNTLNHGFGSPRYHALLNLETLIVPEDYSLFDSLNGTCDKYFPCYSLISSTKPVTEFIDNLGVATTIAKGPLSMRELSTNKLPAIIGRNDSPARPFNSTLARHKVFTTTLGSSLLNPGWCNIQVKEGLESGKTTYAPQYIIRNLGNTSSIAQLYAIPIDDKAKLGASTFYVGDITIYKNNLWRCKVETLNLPPVKPETPSQEWDNVSESSVFNSDVFAVTPTSSAYLMSAKDEERQFNPSTDEPESLIAWSVAYYHGD